MDNTTFRDRFFSQLDPATQVFQLFDLLPSVSFFVKDAKGRFVAINQRACRYCGVSTEIEAIGKTDFDFFPKHRAEEYQADDLAVLETGEPILNRIESAPEAAGSPRLVMTTKIPLRGVRGRIIGTAGFSRQVDQLREHGGTVSAFSAAVKNLHENFASNLSTQELANASGLSTSQFERRFRKAFGTSVRQYLLRIRIENATKLLEETNRTISQIALDCGFFDHAHFSRSFKTLMQMPPSKFRSQSKHIG